MEPKGRGTIEYLPELLRMPLLSTRMNKALSPWVAITSAGKEATWLPQIARFTARDVPTLP
jgi:hypothetical protein